MDNLLHRSTDDVVPCSPIVATNGTIDAAKAQVAVDVAGQGREAIDHQMRGGFAIGSRERTRDRPELTIDLLQVGSDQFSVPSFTLVQMHPQRLELHPDSPQPLDKKPICRVLCLLT
jgi:hypothetical protein